MGWRNTGNFREPQEIQVMTCDVCERDIGYEDERRPMAHYEVRRLPNQGGIDDQQAATLVCSAECLRVFANQVSMEPGRLPPRTGGAAVPRKLRKK